MLSFSLKNNSGFTTLFNSQKRNQIEGKSMDVFNQKEFKQEMLRLKRVLMNIINF